MKKSIFSLMVVAILFMVIPSNLKANDEVNKASDAKAVIEAKAEIKKMADRVKEINEMNFETLSKEEKKELKAELRNIKSEFKAYSKSDSPAVSEAASEAVRGTGIYISGGALLIIIILLLLL